MYRETHVLVVEEDERSCELLADRLREAGLKVSVARSYTGALELVSGDMIDVVLTDDRLGAESGINLLAAVRARPLPPEVILLTEQASLEISIAALRTRAFDYIQKPVAMAELLDTIERAALQRRDALRRAEAIRLLASALERELGAARLEALEPPGAHLERSRAQQFGAIQIDYFQRIVTLRGIALHLTPTEYALISCLSETPGRVVSAVSLVRRTHGYEASPDEAQALLRGHVRNLRRKVPGGVVVTVRGSGYMLVPPEP